jgi:CspA family cold shock protein
MEIHQRACGHIAESGAGGRLAAAPIEATGYRSLDEGARVSFVVKRGPKGLQAEEVNLA